MNVNGQENKLYDGGVGPIADDAKSLA